MLDAIRLKVSGMHSIEDFNLDNFHACASQFSHGENFTTHLKFALSHIPPGYLTPSHKQPIWDVLRALPPHVPTQSLCYQIKGKTHSSLSSSMFLSFS